MHRARGSNLEERGKMSEVKSEVRIMHEVRLKEVGTNKQGVCGNDKL